MGQFLTQVLLCCGPGDQDTGRCGGNEGWNLGHKPITNR